jgi:16S rRNA (cytosine967-C5)-methyltransferase
LPEPVQPIYGTGRDNALRFLRQQGITFDPSLLLSGTPGFSAGITREHWVDSLLQKPDLFIRLTKKYAASALKKLHEAGIHMQPVENLDHYSWRLPNGTPVEKILAEKEYRVQDASSQLTGRFLPIENGFQCWDCCSGAGGKSLLIMDRQPGVQLCVSDIRKSILENLADRFRLYGHRVPERVVVSVADREQVARMMNSRMFDLVVADVPCSGSGTWARTPEQLYFFNPDVIKTFSHTQKQIASNAIEHVKPGGYFTYITCSVFAEENEVVVTQLLEENGDFHLSEQLLINGVSGKADSMFIAVLQRKIKDQ